MRTSLTLAVAGTVLTSGAMLAIAGPANAATMTKAPTTLMITAARSRIVPGQQDIISGALSTGMTPRAGRTITLYRFDATSGKWVLAGTDRTGNTGRVAFAVKPMTTTVYRLTFDGSRTLAPADSAVAVVTV
jgi:hypothetical protein